MKKLSAYPSSTPDAAPLDFGVVNNETSSGAQDGTPVDAELWNDVYYALYAVFLSSGINAGAVSGSSETTATSDFSAAINALITTATGPFEGITEFESVETSIPAENIEVSAVHGLGVVPKLAQTVIRCKTAEWGYAIGDEIPLANDRDDSSRGLSIWQNASTLGMVYDGSINVVRRDTPGTEPITPARWKVVFKAWA